MPGKINIPVINNGSSAAFHHAAADIIVRAVLCVKWNIAAVSCTNPTQQMISPGVQVSF